MISRGVGGHTSLDLRVGEREESVEGAPKLEGSHLLEVLALEEEPLARDPIETPRSQNGSAMSVATNLRRRLFDIAESGIITFIPKDVNFK